MPTTDRTTIKAAVAALVTKLRTNLVANPTTASKPFRRVEAGKTTVEEFARPFLAVHLTQARPIGVTDNDKLVEVSATLRIVTDVTQADPHDALLDKVGATDDYLDSLIDPGVIDGAEGFDDRTWTFDFPRTTAGARVAVAEASQRFTVKIERLQNREPAS